MTPTGPDQLPAGFVRQEHTVRGTRYSVLVGGSGPPLLLLHGWPQTAHCWRHLLSPLAELGHTVLAPDLRGTGRTGRPPNGYGKDDQAEDLRDLLRTLGLGPRVRLIGHDIGGMVAFAYARRHPEHVERLVLIELAVPGLDLDQAMNVARGGLWHFGFFMTPQVPEMLLLGHEHEFFSWWCTQLSHQLVDPESLAATTHAYSGRPALTASLGHYRTLLDDSATNRAWLAGGGQLHIPVLAVGAEHGVGGQLAQALLPAVPGVSTLTVQASGHFVPEEAPQALLAELRPFLAHS